MNRPGHGQRGVVGRLCVVRSLWPPAVGAVSLFSFAIVTHAVWPQLLGCALVGLIVSSLLAVAWPAPIDASLELPDRVVVGRPFETIVHIRALGSGPSRPLIVRHRMLGPRRLVHNHATLVAALAAHGEVVVRAGRTPRARGAIESSRIEIDAVAPFGFFTRRTIIDVERPLLVLPALTPALALPAAAGVDAGLVDKTNGLDAGAVRDWRPGDQVRNVQWRSTARTGRLTVLEREDLSAGSLVALVVGRTGDVSFEAALATAAATAVAALHQGQPVVVVTSQRAFSCGHLRDEAGLLEFFARIDVAEPIDQPTLHRAFGYAGRGGTLLVAAGPATAVAWRQQVGSVGAAAGVRVVDLASPRSNPTARATAVRQS